MMSLLVKLIAAFTVSTLFFLLSSMGGSADNLLHIYFLDVGQGDSILIQTPGEQHILIDAGGGDSVIGRLSKALPLTEKGLELCILTHPHEDHLGGFLQVLDYYDCKIFLQNNVECESQLCKSWNRIAKEQKQEFDTVNAGDEIKIEEDLEITILWPRNESDLIDSNLNNTSIVFLLEYKDFRAIFTGDAEKEVEEVLVSQNDLDAELLKVGHHGSNTSSTGLFISEISPEIAVISVGAENFFGHPSMETLDILNDDEVEVHRTDEVGTIEVVTDGKYLWIAD